MGFGNPLLALRISPVKTCLAQGVIWLSIQGVLTCAICGAKFGINN
jgi:hypothetical protein